MSSKNNINSKNILVVEDQDACRITTKWFLTNMGYTVQTAQSAEEALAVFQASVHDLIVTDNLMAGISGEEMAHIIKLRSPTTKIIMYSANLPLQRSCLDFALEKSAHLLALKDKIEELLNIPQESHV